MLLHEQNARARLVHRHMMNAVANLSIGVGNVLGLQPAIDRLPRLAAIVGAKGSGGGNSDVDATGIARVENDGVQAHAAGAGLPVRARAMAAQAWKFLPSTAAVG